MNALSSSGPGPDRTTYRVNTDCNSLQAYELNTDGAVPLYLVGHPFRPYSQIDNATLAIQGSSLILASAVRITAPGTDAIYFTTNCDVPTTLSAKYISPIPLSATVGATMTVQSFATAWNQVQSPTVSRPCTTEPQAAKPTFTPTAGAVAANTSVAIATTTTPGATIYFTMDGSDPMVKAIAVSPTTSASAVATAQYNAKQ